MSTPDPRSTSQGSSGRRNVGWGSTGDPSAGGDTESAGADAGGTGGHGAGGRGTDSRGPGGGSNRWSGFGGGGFGGSGRRPGFGGGMPNIFLIGAALIFMIGAFLSCTPTPSGPGRVAGQVTSLGADRAVTTLVGAQVILRGADNTYTTVSADTPEGAQGTDAYNYRIDNVPPGRYTMSVTPPAGSGLQPEADITLEVKPTETFPQSVMLLAEGIQKPRPLAPSEMNPGETGYVNERGERVVYREGSGFGLDDALLMYLLFRNPPGYGYGAPPVFYPSRTAGTPYRVDPPPSQTRTGERVTTRPPSVPGQGSTRPSSAPSTGSGPTYRPSNDDGPGTGAAAPAGSTTKPGSGASSSGSGSSSSSQPSQGVTRPSSAPRSSAPAPSRSGGGSRSSGSSSGGRR